MIKKRKDAYDKEKEGEHLCPPSSTVSQSTRNVRSQLPAATAAYRSNVGHRQMTVLVWIIFRLVLCSLLGVVHLLMVNRPSDSYRLPHIITQVRPITFQFPSRAVIRHQLVIASLQNSFTSAFRMTSGQTPTVR